jgi:nucleoside-diphosphate-sugar epimerase
MVSPATDGKLVTLTGISGYIGMHVGLALQREGFRVRGTVRDPTNAKKTQPIKDAFGDRFSEIELVKAELLDHESI